jgi:hypothetical protein
VCVSVWLASHRRTLCRTLGNGDSFFLAVGCAVGYLSAVQALWPDAAASAWVGRLRSMAVDFVLHNLQWSLNATAGDALHSLRDLGVWILPYDTEALATVMRAVGQILGRRIVSLTPDSPTGSSFSGSLCIYDPLSPHVFPSWYDNVPGVVTDSDVVVCNSGNLHFGSPVGLRF